MFKIFTIILCFYIGTLFYFVPSFCNYVIHLPVTAEESEKNREYLIKTNPIYAENERLKEIIKNFNKSKRNEDIK